MPSTSPYKNPPHSIGYGPNENCTLAICDVRTSVLTYQPNLAVNAVFIALFGLSLLIHVVQGLRWKTWAFMIAMFLGCAVEMAGYGGRLMMHNNPFSFAGFITQIVCITIGPAFFSAAIYFTLSQIVRYLGARYSRFHPSWYYYFFISADIISLTLQGTGGGMSSNSSGRSQIGVDIALAGLSFQVFTLTIFSLLSVDYMLRYRSHRGDVRLSRSFKIFASFLSLAIILILARCVYRIDELSHGYSGAKAKLVHNENLFIGLEGVLIIAAAFALNIGHPGTIFKSSGILHPDGPNIKRDGVAH